VCAWRFWLLKLGHGRSHHLTVALQFVFQFLVFPLFFIDLLLIVNVV